jgi:hypothetical protein
MWCLHFYHSLFLPPPSLGYVFTWSGWLAGCGFVCGVFVTSVTNVLIRKFVGLLEIVQGLNLRNWQKFNLSCFPYPGARGYLFSPGLNIPSGEIGGVFRVHSTHNFQNWKERVDWLLTIRFDRLRVLIGYCEHHSLFAGVSCFDWIETFEFWNVYII